MLVLKLQKRSKRLIISQHIDLSHRICSLRYTKIAQQPVPLFKGKQTTWLYWTSHSPHGQTRCNATRYPAMVMTHFCFSKLAKWYLEKVSPRIVGIAVVLENNDKRYDSSCSWRTPSKSIKHKAVPLITISALTTNYFRYGINWSTRLRDGDERIPWNRVLSKISTQKSLWLRSSVNRIWNNWEAKRIAKSQTWNPFWLARKWNLYLSSAWRKLIQQIAHLKPTTFKIATVGEGKQGTSAKYRTGYLWPHIGAGISASDWNRSVYFTKSWRTIASNVPLRLKLHALFDVPLPISCSSKESSNSYAMGESTNGVAILNDAPTLAQSRWNRWQSFVSKQQAVAFSFLGTSVSSEQPERIRTPASQKVISPPKSHFVYL